MLEQLVNKFIDWWKLPNSLVSRELFSEDVYFKTCTHGNAREFLFEPSEVPVSSDFKLLKSFFNDKEGMVLFEDTDEITNLYYRIAIYLKSDGSKISEVVMTKESVANEAKL